MRLPTFITKGRSNTNQNDKNPSKLSAKQTLQRGSRGAVRVEQTNEKKNRNTHTALDDR